MKDIPRDYLRGQKISLLGDDLAQFFPSSFLNYRQILLKSSAALSAIGTSIKHETSLNLLSSPICPAGKIHFIDGLAINPAF